MLLPKIRQIYKILDFIKKIRRICETLGLPKSRRIYKILSFTENQVDDRILAGVEIPTPGKKPAGLEKLAARLLFRVGGNLQLLTSSWSG